MKTRNGNGNGLFESVLSETDSEKNKILINKVKSRKPLNSSEYNRLMGYRNTVEEVLDKGYSKKEIDGVEYFVRKRFKLRRLPKKVKLRRLPKKVEVRNWETYLRVTDIVKAYREQPAPELERDKNYGTQTTSLTTNNIISNSPITV